MLYCRRSVTEKDSYVQSDKIRIKWGYMVVCKTSSGGGRRMPTVVTRYSPERAINLLFDTINTKI